MGVAPLGGFASVDDVFPLQEVTGATTGSSCVRFPHGAPSDRLQEFKDPDPALLIRLICYPVSGYLAVHVVYVEVSSVLKNGGQKRNRTRVASRMNCSLSSKASNVWVCPERKEGCGDSPLPGVGSHEKRGLTHHVEAVDEHALTKD